MSDEIEKDVENFHKNREIYYGFNRIKISTCSVILAKKNDFYLKNNKIYILYNNKECLYTPILYNVSSLNIDISKEFENYKLEKFPLLNDKPLFDHYWILYPCFDDINESFVFNDIETRKGKAVLIGEADSKSYFICEI